MCLVIGSAESLHSEPKNIFMVSEAVRRPLAKNPDHAGRGDRSWNGDVYRLRIGTVPLRTHRLLPG